MLGLLCTYGTPVSLGYVDAGGDNKAFFMRPAYQFWPVCIEIAKRQNVIWLMIIRFGGGWYLGTQLTSRQQASYWITTPDINDLFTCGKNIE